MRVFLVARRYQFQILAPKLAVYDPVFPGFTVSEVLYRSRLDALQRLRGRLYCEDGAIGTESLDSEGRFHISGDEQAWHLGLTDAEGNVIGCARYLVHPNTVPYRMLRISHSALGKNPEWSPLLQQAVETDLRIARQRRLLYVELGGWALAQEWRKTKAALEMVVGSYALCRIWGGALGYCMATVLHGSASILRRLGGSSFTANGEALPSYFDPRYGCFMELLRFDYLTPEVRILPMIDVMQGRLVEAEVITGRLVQDRRVVRG